MTKLGTTWAHLHLPRAKRGDDYCISVKKGDEPVDYREWLILADVVFHVRENGRQKTLREGVKNVHAWVVGTEVRNGPHDPWGPVWREARYNPRSGPKFTDAETGAELLTASYAWLDRTKVYYLP